MADVSKPYAEALYELAIENGGLDALYQQALDLLGLFRDGPEPRGLIQNPRITPEDKASVLRKALAGIDCNLSGLMAVMLKKGRGAYIESALYEFARLAQEYKGVAKARVYSAVPLSEGQVSALRDKLAAKTGKSIDIETFTDPSLIGGLLIKVGGMVFDNTIKNQLRTLRNRLA